MAIDLAQIAGPWVLTLLAVLGLGGLWIMVRHTQGAPPDAAPSASRVAPPRGLGWR